MARPRRRPAKNMSPRSAENLRPFDFGMEHGYGVAHEQTLDESSAPTQDAPAFCVSDYRHGREAGRLFSVKPRGITDPVRLDAPPERQPITVVAWVP